MQKNELWMSQLDTVSAVITKNASFFGKARLISERFARLWKLKKNEIRNKINFEYQSGFHPEF